MRQREKKHKGRIPLDQIDILEVLDELSIDYRESGKNVGVGWVGVCCCFCGEDGFHLGINLQAKTCTCFKCGTTGNIISYLAEELNSFPKAMEILGNSVPREMRLFEEKSPERSVTVALPKEATKKIGKYHARYLNERGYSWKELTEKYDLHFCSPGSYWSNRIIVPVKKRGRLITFTSIDIADDSFLRYKHLSDDQSVISIKQYLFGLDFAKGNSVCLVEGLFDQFKIGDGCVCGFGVVLTAEQKLLLAQFQKVVIAFDGDSAGKVGAEKIANDLATFCDVEILDLPEGSDPDKLSKEDVRYVRNKIGRE